MPGAQARMRRTLIQLVLFLAPSALTAQAVASAERCNELRALYRAAWREFSAAEAVGKDYNRITQLNSLEAAATRQSTMLAKMKAENRNLIEELLGDEALRAGKMRDFAAQAGLPNDVQALITANRPEEFWRRAELEIKRRVRDEVERPQSREAAARTKAAKEREDKAWQEFYQAGCFDAPDQPAAAPPATPEGPLPVPLHPAGDRPWSDTPILTDAVITRWTVAHRAAMGGGRSPWQAGRMTQLYYLAITGRMRDFSSLGCTQSREGEVTRVTCRITAANRASLERYFTPEEIAALTARQDDLGSALSTPGS